jgi:hypothetical protein
VAKQQQAKQNCSLHGHEAEERKRRQGPITSSFEDRIPIT